MTRKIDQWLVLGVIVAVTGIITMVTRSGGLTVYARVTGTQAVIGGALELVLGVLLIVGWFRKPKDK